MLCARARLATSDHVFLASWVEFRRRCTVNVRMQSLAVVVGILWTVTALSAHHSWPVSYSKMVSVKGTVTMFAWQNPHPMISLDVRRDDGTMEKWEVGGPAITRMQASGWSRTTLKVGDVITGIGY